MYRLKTCRWPRFGSNCSNKEVADISSDRD